MLVSITSMTVEGASKPVRSLGVNERGQPLPFDYLHADDDIYSFSLMHRSV